MSYEIAMRSPDAGMMKSLGWTAFSPRIKEGFNVERGSVIGFFHGSNADHVDIYSPASGRIDRAVETFILEESDLLLRINCDGVNSRDRMKVAEEVFQGVEGLFVANVNKARAHLKSQRLSLFWLAPLFAAFVFGGLKAIFSVLSGEPGFAGSSGLEIAGAGLLAIVFGAGGFYMQKGQFDDAKKWVQRLPSQGDRSVSYRAAISLHEN